MPMLDIFNSEAFGVVPLTDALNKLKFVPGLIGSMNLFAIQGIATTDIAIEERDGLLKLIPPSERGGPGTTQDKLLRTLRKLSVPHFEVNLNVMAEEVQGVRAFGSETDVQTVQMMLARYMTETTQSFDATEEYARMGAIKGIVTYSGGDTLDLFSEFNVTQESERDWDLDNGSPAAGVLRKTCAAVIRQMAGLLEGIPFNGLHAFCGDNFFDDLIAHTEVRDTFLQWSDARELCTAYVAGGQSFGSFFWGGISWENYRGSVDGTDYIDTDKCHVFPLGVPSLFRTYFSPADYLETVNTIGRRLTAKTYNMANDKGVHFDMQMNALNICTRPKTLLQGRRT